MTPRLPRLDDDTTRALNGLLKNSYWRAKSDEVLARKVGVDPKYIALARSRRPSELNKRQR